MSSWPLVQLVRRQCSLTDLPRTLLSLSHRQRVLEAGERGGHCFTRSNVLPRCAMQQQQQRAFHLQSSVHSWRLRMRPDLKDHNHWDIVGTPEAKKERYENFYWWHGVPVDKWARTIANDLANEGSIREGILYKFAMKAQRPYHLKVLMQAIAWIQARFNQDMGKNMARRIADAARRAKSPDMALRILNAPYIRIWPDTHTGRVLLLTCAEMAEDSLLKSPLLAVPKWYEPVYEEDKAADVKSSSASPTPSRFARPAATEEKAPKKEKAEDYGGKDLNSSFQRVVNYVFDERLAIKPDDFFYDAMARFYACVGNEEEINKLLKIAPRRVSMYSYIRLAKVVKGEYEAALEPPPVDSPAATVVHKPSFVRSQLMALLALGRKEDAYKLLKLREVEKWNTSDLAFLSQSHLGHQDRVNVIRELFARLEAESEASEADWTILREYLSKLDTAIKANSSTPL